SHNQIPHSLVLEWSGIRGWTGSAELLSRSGIAQSGGIGVSPDPVSGIQQLAGTLRASKERSTEGRVPMLKGGLVALYDLESERDHPGLLCALADLSQVLSSISGSAVLLLSQPLP